MVTPFIAALCNSRPSRLSASRRRSSALRVYAAARMLRPAARPPSRNRSRQLDPAACFSALLLRLLRRRLIEVVGAQRGIGQYRRRRSAALRGTHPRRKEDAALRRCRTCRRTGPGLIPVSNGACPGMMPSSPIAARRDHHRHAAGEDLLLGADDVAVHGHRHDYLLLFQLLGFCRPRLRSCRPCRTPARAGDRIRRRESL